MRFLSLCFVLFFGCVLSWANTLGLELFWPIDDGKVSPVTNIINDDEGKGYLKGQVDLDRGIRGYALDFYDQDGFYEVHLPEQWVFSDDGFSLAFWLYHRGIDKDTVLFQAAGFQIGGDPIYKDRLCLNLLFADGDREIIRFPIDLPQREWIHIAVVVGRGRVDLYVNGKLSFSESYWVGELKKDDDPVREQIFIAGDGEKNTFSGKMDEIAWFSRRIGSYECAKLI